MGPHPGEPWREFLIRAKGHALAHGVVVVFGVSYTAADLDRVIVAADDAEAAPVARLESLGGTVPTAPQRVVSIALSQAGATGVTALPVPEPEPDDPNGATGSDLV